MPNAFESARRVEAESRRILEPLLELNTQGRYVYTDKGRLAKEFQRQHGDILVNMAKTKELCSIELKAERRATGNLFLEFWSNGSKFNFGWMAYSDADLLFYHFLDADELYIVPMHKLKRWFWLGIGPKRKDGTSRIHRPGFVRFPLKLQNKYDQMNDTWGVPVPALVIRQEVGLKMVNPLGLFRFEDAQKSQLLLQPLPVDEQGFEARFGESYSKCQTV